MEQPSLKKLALKEGELQITSAANAMWQLVRDLPEEGQRIVLAALDVRLEGPRLGPAQEQAVSALKACRAEAGNTSRSTYRRWREDQPDPDAWPTVKAVHRAFGCWRQAREAVGDGDPSQAGDHRLWLLPDATPEHLMAQLRIWVSKQPQNGPCRQSDFFAWLAEKQGAADTESLFPRSSSALYRRIGPWPDALRRAGRLKVSVDGPFEDLVRGRLDFQVLAPTGREYDIQQLTGWALYLRELLGTRGLLVFTKYQYTDLRAAILQEAWDRRLKVAVPSGGTIHNIAGSWTAFKGLAGIEELAREPSNGRTGPPRFLREAIVNAVADAAADLGPRFTIEEFCRWRQREAEQGRIRPSHQSIYSRLKVGRKDWEKILPQMHTQR